MAGGGLLNLIRSKAMGETVVCIDPGVRTGWALIQCGQIYSRGTTHARGVLPAADACIVEMPRVYANPGKWKGDPQDIARLAALAGEYAGRYVLSDYVEPRAWRGMVPEKVLLRRIERSLRADEPLGASVHARDAQGIALWLMGRLK